MEWLAENANNGYFLLAFAAFMLAGVWWIQRQVIYLIGAGAALVLLLVFWLVIRNVPTTATKIEADLNSLAQALLAKDQDKANRYVVPAFKYKGKDRDKWYATIEKLIDEDAVDAIEMKQFTIRFRGDDETTVIFHLQARHKGQLVFSAECPWTMTRANDAWQVQKVQLRKLVTKAGKHEDSD